MFVSTFIEEMDFVGCSNRNGRIDRHVGDSYSDDSLMVVLELFDLGFGEETHQINMI